MSADAFDQLDPGLPLTLLPVRIEARYLPRTSPKDLCVRIFPDVIHADGHRPALTTRELAAGHQYWTSIWGTADAATISAARASLAAQSTPYRALWIATATTPINLDAPTDPAPTFGEVAVDDTSMPVRASLLPDEWMVRLYDADLNLVHTDFSETIKADLAMAPSLSSAGTEAVHPVTGKALAAPLAFLAGQDLLWTVDFDLAIEYGMALRIPLADVPDPVGALLVLGVRAGREPLAEAGEFDRLLTAHWYTRGLDAVAQGTATNNSDAGRSGVSLSSPDVDALFERELHQRPLAPLGRAVLVSVDPALLYRLPAADSMSIAAGRLPPNRFDHIALADWGEGAAAWSTNAAVGYATNATYINDPFATSAGATFIGDDAGTLRDWYVDWVRGGALLPTLRCGEQPYGLLPVTHRPGARPDATAFDDVVEGQVHELRSVWEAALPIPCLDPNATDSLGNGTPIGDATIIASVLGAVPHLIAMQLRSATNHLADDLAAFADLAARIDAHANGDDLLDPTHTSAVLSAWHRRQASIFGVPERIPPVEPPAVAEQLANLAVFEQEVADARDAATYPTEAADAILELIADELRPLLEVYQEALDAVPATLAEWAGHGGLGTTDLVNLVATTFDDSGVPVIDLVSDDGTVTGIRDLIVTLRDELRVAQRDGIPAAERRSLLESPAPLLAHLLHVNYLTVPVDDIGPNVVALTTLLAMIDSDQVDDPVAQLERLTREVVGVSTYRLDAWITSIAAKRLAERRQKRPAGAQFGGFGWLLDLAQRSDPVSQGFIHAPSLTHAATAAVLRSGWSAFGTDDGAQPLSVDLSSHRVRGAQWILDAVRNGQDLGEQLGARFERSLHDGRLDEWIETVRLLALDARSVDRPPSRTVDGLLVARGALGIDLTDQEASFRSALMTATAPTIDPEETRRRAAVRRWWQRLGADLDGVADLTMAQMVHSLVQGNDAHASALMGISGGGDAAVPRIDVTATQRDAQLVHHRVVALWSATDGTPASDEEAIALGKAEPRLTGWLRDVLPRPNDVVAGYRITGDDGVTTTGSLSLEDVGLTATEAASLAARAPSQQGSRLGRVVLAHVASRAPGADATEVVLDTAARGGPGTMTLDEFGVVGAALTGALGRMRALKAADLVQPAVDPSTLPAADVDELRRRVTDVASELRTLESALAAAPDVGTMTAGQRRALLRCTGLRVRGAVRALEDNGSATSLAVVRDELTRRLEGTIAGPAEPVESVAEILRRSIGDVLPILPVFTPAADPDRHDSALSRDRRLQAATRAPMWLYQAAHARQDLAATSELLQLAEAATGRPIAQFGLAQMPHHDDAWAAVGRPGDDTDRVSIVSLTGPRALATTDTAVAGLFIDGWTEGIPKPSIQTGIAVHFDAPSARPPQSILLSVVDDERGFSADDLSDQLLHTVSLAKMRAVAPADLPEIGHFLPAVALPVGITISDTGQEDRA